MSSKISSAISKTSFYLWESLVLRNTISLRKFKQGKEWSKRGRYSFRWDKQGRPLETAFEP